MSSLDALIADRDAWQDRALTAEAELAELYGMAERLAQMADLARLRCEQFENSKSIAALFRELAAVLRTMQTPAPADGELAAVVPIAGRRP